LRNGTPTRSGFQWPTPHDVHLIEWVGALNTFVLIVSSLTVVLAHYAAHHGNFKQATMYIGVTLALGLVFLVVKYTEYKSKWDHDILPGHIGESLIGPKVTDMTVEREKLLYANGMQYVDRVRGQLNALLVVNPVTQKSEAELAGVKDEVEALLKGMEAGE